MTDQQPNSVDPRFDRTARSPCPPVPLRRELLRDSLPLAVDLLARRRADLVAAGFIEDYVALGWLRWDGDVARLTAEGRLICKQLHAMPRH